VNPGEPILIRDTGVDISRLGLGTAPLGNLFARVDGETASAVVAAALEHGITFYDTAPVYGFGLAEQRLGGALAHADRRRLAISTKVGRLLRADAPPDPELFHDGEPYFKDTPPVNPVWDFTRRGVQASIEESLERLGLDRVDIVFVHEPPDAYFDEAITQAHRALRDLQQQGTVGAVGLGWDRPERMAQFLRRADCDCILLAGRYTLLDQSALAELLPLCRRRRTAVIAGGVFNSGVLADPRPGATYDYTPASSAMVERAERIKAACNELGISLTTAALAFPFTDPAVASVLIGVRTLEELREDVTAFSRPVPPSLWARLVKARLLSAIISPDRRP
jgi:D-threo-aldose 1-dehydrogenase